MHRFQTQIISSNSTDALDQALKWLKLGEVVALPTETVYGLAADACNNEALGRIYSIKNRPLNHPVIVHIGSKSQIPLWADVSDTSISKRANLLADKFWPGALTIILPIRSTNDHGLPCPNINAAIKAAAGHETIALRCPAHGLFLKACENFKGIAAPSANKFGRLSATTALDVKAELDGQIALIIDDGPAQGGLESTIVSCLDPPTILRPGLISRQQIEECLGESLHMQYGKENTSSIAAPGNLDRHYAPQKPLWLVSNDNLADVLLELESRQLSLLAIKDTQSEDNLQMSRNPNINIHFASSEAKEYARSLYQNLRIMDKEGTLLIVAIPGHLSTNSDDYLWESILDRLQKASEKVLID